VVWKEAVVAYSLLFLQSFDELALPSVCLAKSLQLSSTLKINFIICLRGLEWNRVYYYGSNLLAYFIGHGWHIVTIVDRYWNE
jgi:hypothetical protein